MSENNSVTDIDEFFKTERLMGELAVRSIQGGAITMVAQGTKFCLQVGSVVVLARLLLPSDYGLVDMVIAITGFVMMFKDIGLSMATIQRKEISHKQISTLFWVNVLLGFGIMVMMATLAPVVAWFYGEPRLTDIVLILATVFFFGGLTIQHRALLKRQMYFGRLAAIEITSIAIGVIVAIVSACYGAGYWSLVLMQIGTAISNTVGAWVACKWRPGLPVRNSGVRSMLAFGGNITAFNVVNYFARNLDKVLIGRCFGPNPLGLYSRAYQILMMPIMNIRQPISAVAIPALSRLQDDPDRYRRYYMKMVLLIGLLSTPVVTFFFVMSDELVLLILGNNWMGVSVFFKILAIIAFLQPMVTMNGVVYISLGQTKRLLQWGIWNSIIIVTGFSVGLKWGVRGVAIGYAVATYLMLFPTLWHCFRYSPINIRVFFDAIWRPALASLIMGVVIFFSLSFMVGQSHFIKIIACLIIGLAVYFLAWLVIPGGKDILHELYNYILLVTRKKN